MISRGAFSRAASKRIQFLITSRSISSLPPLPPFDEWKAKYTPQSVSGRILMKNPKTATLIAKSFMNAVPSTSKGKKKETVVIEAFPGK